MLFELFNNNFFSTWVLFLIYHDRIELSVLFKILTKTGLSAVWYAVGR